VDSPETGTGRRDFLPLFDQGGGTRTIKHPATTDISSIYNSPITMYLRDQTGNLQEAMKEANRLAQQKIDDFFAQNPGAAT
jgi:hypothetical protein